MNQRNLGLVLGLGLAGCQVIVGITDRTEGSDAAAPGAGTGSASGSSGSSPASNGGSTGKGGSSQTGSAGVAGSGASAGAGSGAAPGGGGSSGSGSGAVTGRGGSAGVGGAPGSGGASGGGIGGTTPVAGSGQTACVSALAKCPAGLTCIPKPGTAVGACVADCTSGTCAARHFCLTTPSGPRCVEDCSGPCSGTGFNCYTPSSGQPYCIPDPWFFGLTGAACRNDSNCLSNYCLNGLCTNCIDNSDCIAGATGTSDICGILSGTTNAICFHDCSGDPTICSKYYAEPASSCKAVSGTQSTCGY